MKHDMMKCWMVSVWLAAGAAAGCTLFNEFNIDEDDEELCKDNKDNDSDGLKDCLDPECAEFDHCKEQPHPDDDYEYNDNFCFDGIDQGGDGVYDCMVEACQVLPECIEEGDVECRNHEDDNRNGQVDCQEDTCKEDAYCLENYFEHCTDSFDNDADTLVDCADQDCRDFDDTLCWESSWLNCHDGVDNDLDGWYDCSDGDCGERGFCPEEDLERWCKDEADNDGADGADCYDPDCSRFVKNGCDPEWYSDKILQEEFDSAELDQWMVYEHDPEGAAIKIFDVMPDETLHLSVANQDTTVPSRVEYGVASRQRFFLWNNVTDIVFEMKVRELPERTFPSVPGVMGLSVDATGFKPFLDKGPDGVDRIVGRHSALMLLVDGRGGIQLCFRRAHDTRMTCYPEGDPLPPETEIPEDTFAKYRLYIDDSVVIVYQNDVFRLEIPRPFLPGMARLFFMGSTDEAFEIGASELFVNYAAVYQAFPFSVETEESFGVPPEVDLAYAEWTDPERELLRTSSPEYCQYAPSGEIEATWLQTEPAKCSLHFEENFAMKRVQVQYDFLVNFADSGTQYVPGLWNPLMDYDSGLPLAAGMHFWEDGNRFVFFPCRRMPMEPDENEEMPAPPPGTVINVVMGYDPDNNYSYAVLKDADSDRDFWSYGSYITTCYELTDFGISSMYCSMCMPIQAEGIIKNIAISTHTPDS